MHDARSDITLERIGRESDAILLNLFELYLHDMAEWFRFDTGADGRYGYDTEGSVWAPGYDVFLARVGSTLAGFAIVGAAPDWYEHPHVQDVHEFFVIRKFRHAGIGQYMARALWDRTPGEWLVRVLEANAPAVPFWRSTIATYSDGAYLEERRLRNDRPWRFFRFRAPLA
jgi:predicted acetyltransferase